MEETHEQRVIRIGAVYGFTPEESLQLVGKLTPKQFDQKEEDEDDE